MSRKRLTSADVVEMIASNTGVAVEHVKTVLKAQAELAYSNVSHGFPIPGIGLFMQTERPARRMILRFGPDAGKEVTIPAKQQLKFRLSRLAQTMVRRPSAPMPDLFQPVSVPALTFSSHSTELHDPSMFVSDLGPFTLALDGKPASVRVFQIPDLWLPKGRIGAGDGLIGGRLQFTKPIPPGRYPLALAVVRMGEDERIALAIIRFSKGPVVKWEIAALESSQTTAEDASVTAYGVDSGTGSFFDPSVQDVIAEAYEAGVEVSDLITEEMSRIYENTRQWVHIESPNGSMAVFSSGGGDGAYTSYFGINDSGDVTALVTDFAYVKWGPIRRK